jgi:type IV pilus assembly protein PilC
MSVAPKPIPKKTMPAASNARASEAYLGGISLKSVEGFCQRMATGLRAGVDILRLLEVEQKLGNSRYRDAIQNMDQLIRSGETLAGAMSNQGNFFPTLLIRVIRAGEHSGQIERSFLEMANYYRELRRTRGAFIGQITFPIISLGLAFFVITLIIYINGFMKSGSPTEPAFDLTGLGLRGGTGVLIFWGTSFFFVVTLGVLAFGIWKNWLDCHKKLVPLVRNVPVVGPVFTTTALSRLSMTLSMMLGAGVDAKRSVREALLSTGNHYYMAGLERTLSELEKGKSFAESLDAPKLLPQEFIQVVEIGELSGSDSESLERLAETYREKAQLALRQLAVAAGLAIWLMIAGIIIFAIFMIFFQIMQVYTQALKM